MISTHVPQPWRDQLIAAAEKNDLVQIDKITDALWRIGYCRHRKDLRKGYPAVPVYGQVTGGSV